MYDIIKNGPPAHFDYYLPDDTAGGCVVIMMPSAGKGAINISEDEPILIGVYKDYSGHSKYLFKLVPSLVDISEGEVNRIIEDTMPKSSLNPKFFNLSSGKIETVPMTVSRDINFTKASTEKKVFEQTRKEFFFSKYSTQVFTTSEVDVGIPEFENGQHFSSDGKAIKKQYDDSGLPVEVKYFVSNDDTQNREKLYSPPSFDKNGEIIMTVYDKFGAAVEGVTYTQFKVTIPSSAVDRNGSKVTKVYDQFGNEIAGRSLTGFWIIYPQRLPILLGANRKPLKKPIDTYYRDEEGNYVFG